MKRVEARLRSIPLLFGLPLFGLVGCYAHHTADEGLLNIDFPEEDAGTPTRDAGGTASDAGQAARDAGTACTQTDTVQRLICEYNQGNLGNGTRRDAGSACTQTDTVQRLICEYNQGNLGTPRRDAGRGQLDPDELQDLIDQLTGGQNGDLNALDLINLLNTLQGDQPQDLQDLLDQLGIPRRDAGSQSQLNAQKCKTTTDLQTLIQCALAGFETGGPN